MAGVGLNKPGLRPRKTSATSRATSHEKRVSGGRLARRGFAPDLGQVQIEPLQRAGDVHDRVDGEAAERRVVSRPGVAEQDLMTPTSTFCSSR